jgi:2-polyprenyl-6-hydroxyphenyl methylase/3-demethylubiquinone-9 3-methyltransferase
VSLLALEGASVVGIDLAEAGLEVAKLHLLESGLDIDYQSISAEELSETETESFDVIACLEMLEHVPDPSLVIEACSKLVKPQWSRSSSQPLIEILSHTSLLLLEQNTSLNLLPKGTHNY